MTARLTKVSIGAAAVTAMFVASAVTAPAAVAAAQRLYGSRAAASVRAAFTARGIL